MILPGRLAKTTLGDVLGTLFRAGVSANLELTEDKGPAAGRTHRLRLRQGLVDGIDSTLGAPPLGELLVQEGALTAQRHIELIQRLPLAREKRTGQWLTELQWVASATVSRALRQQLSRRLNALYELPDARITYRIAYAQATCAVLGEPLSPDQFLRNKPRLRDRSTRSASGAPPHNDLSHREAARIHALLLLGLAPQCSAADIKKAFHRMAARLHPDRHVSAPASHQEAARLRFVQVVNAYNTLLNFEPAGYATRGAA
jgi:hypothetical protein